MAWTRRHTSQATLALAATLIVAGSLFAERSEGPWPLVDAALLALALGSVARLARTPGGGQALAGWPLALAATFLGPGTTTLVGIAGLAMVARLGRAREAFRAGLAIALAASVLEAAPPSWTWAASGLAFCAPLGLVFLDTPRPPWRQQGHLVLAALAWAGAAALPLTVRADPVALRILLSTAAAVAFELHRRDRVVRRARRRGLELESMLTATSRLDGDEAQVAQRILEECRRVVGARGWAEIEMVGPEKLVFSLDPTGRLRPGPATPPDRPPPEPGLRRRRGWLRLKRELATPRGPLARLGFWLPPQTTPREAPELLDRLVPQLATALERSVLGRKARLDPLTGLVRRPTFEAELDRGWADETRLSVVLLDLDHFKRVNDEIGHAAGDEALRVFSRTVREALPEGCLGCRWGGEEIAVLLPERSSERALPWAEELRAAVESTPVVFEDQTLSLTVSGGVATWPELTAPTPNDLMILADEALYAAKGAGRNRVLAHQGRNRFLTVEGETVEGPGGTRELPAIQL